MSFSDLCPTTVDRVTPVELHAQSQCRLYLNRKLASPVSYHYSLIPDHLGGRWRETTGQDSVSIDMKCAPFHFVSEHGFHIHDSELSEGIMRPTYGQYGSTVQGASETEKSGVPAAGEAKPTKDPLVKMEL